MTTPNLGNTLNSFVNSAKSALYEQGELAQLTYVAFDAAAREVQAMTGEEVQVGIPVGYRPDKTTIQHSRVYRKEELLGRFRFLAFNQLAVNGIMQLVTIIEAVLGDIVRVVVMKYPQKLGAKQNVSLQMVLEATSIEEIHLRAADSLLNELSYKSPSEFAESIQKLVSISLLECPAFHKYVEIKATRDIFVHNLGIANEIYLRKAGTHARVAAGTRLPVDIQYFLESYESCLQLMEWLECELHNRWHSSTYEDAQNRRKETQQTPPPTQADVIPSKASPVPQEPQTKQSNSKGRSTRKKTSGSTKTNRTGK